MWSAYKEPQHHHTGRVRSLQAGSIHDTYINISRATYTQRSQDSSVGIATGYGLDDQVGGNSSPGKAKNFHFSISSRPALGSTQPPIKWVPGVKRQWLEADHSPSTSAEVKKMWIYISTPPYVFMT
jgi:hypothetical protein